MAHRFIYKYPYLKNEECISTQETSWIQHLSKGNLTFPSPTNVIQILEKLFKELHCDGLKNKPNIIKDLSNKLKEKKIYKFTIASDTMFDPHKNFYSNEKT